MMPPLSLPDWLNLGVARPAPTGATNVAPRVALVLPFSLNDAYPRGIRGFTPLLMNVFALVLNPAVPGQVFEPVQFTPLLPNPYGG
jgi:hypothetical protein